MAAPSAPVRDWVYDQTAIGFVLSGCFEYQAESGTNMGAPGAIVFGNAGEHFRVRHLDDRGNKRLVVVMDKGLLESAAAACGFDDARFRLPVLPPSKSTSRMFGWMRQLALSTSYCEDALCLLATTALESRQTDRPPERVSARDKRAIHSTIRHIETHFDEPCTLQSLAELAGVSRFHLIRKFHGVVGQSPNQYLINTRIRAAAERLLTSATPIAQVALGVGFNDISHFYACFREAFGCTPRHWRASSGKHH